MSTDSNLKHNVILLPLRAKKLKFVFNQALLIPYWSFLISETTSEKYLVCDTYKEQVIISHSFNKCLLNAN